MPKDKDVNALRENVNSRAAYAARALKIGDPGLARCYHRDNMVSLISGDRKVEMNGRAELFNHKTERILKTRLGLLRLQMNNDRGPKKLNSFRTRALYLMIRSDYFKSDQCAGSYFLAHRAKRDRIYKRFLTDQKIGKRMRTLKFSAELSSALRLLDLNCALNAPRT